MERRLVAILAADMVGYSRLMGLMTDIPTVALDQAPVKQPIHLAT